MAYQTVALEFICENSFFKKRFIGLLAKLKDAMMIANAEREAKAINDVWKRHTQIVRGEAVRKFYGLDFKE